MEIIQLDEKKYKNQPFTVKYKTRGYYDVIRSHTAFSFKYVPFHEEREMQFDDHLFSDWLEQPIAFGAFENSQLLGFVEGSYESWNQRYRISNICIYEAHRGHGIGGELLHRIISAAKERGARMVVLETQSCNEKAISFYKKHGFEIIGFDLYAYSNDDIHRHEVRIEMGLKL